MDFDVTANSTSKTGDSLFTHCTTEQFEEAMVTIRGAMSEWNNFLSGEKLDIVIKKVPSNAETLNVKTGEKLDIKAIFGRP